MLLLLQEKILKLIILKSLGAKTVVNRSEFDKDPRLIDKGLWDGVVDTVGGKILANAIVQTKPNGIIAVCGNANNNELKYKCNTFYA